ncbi:MAG: type IV pilus assembly protein PilM [Phycisphaerae bacterium]
MATGKTVWGIDIGQVALKALKLRDVGGSFQVEAFDIIEHPKILSQPDADRDQLVQTALEQFMARNNVSGSKLVVSVPGQSSFTRFIKLPPVDPKRIPEIVKFEAEQQIPFPINDVIWRWQTFQKQDNPDVELGIFAMKKVDVQDALGYFQNLDLKVDCVQMVPLALCNFMVVDDQMAPDGATLLADVGVDKTDLVVIDGSRIWIRTINLGGSAFTEALVRAFKLPFKKAEKLKRSAASSKYARQIFQAMRPVFADLVQEIQRSIGFYTQMHRETRFKKLIGLGNGFRLPGLQKFLEQNLNIPVVRVDSYNNLQTSDAVAEPAFTENVLSFAVAYGLAAQGLGAAAVDTNLLPDEVTRKRIWVSKRPWFAAAAAMLIAALGVMFYSVNARANTLEEGQPQLAQARNIINQQERRIRDYRELEPSSDDEEMQQSMQLLSYVDYWPNVQTVISESLNGIATHQSLYRRITSGMGQMASLPSDSAEYQQLKQEVDQAKQQLKDIPRNRRQIIFLTGKRVEYVDDMSVVDERFLQRQAEALLTGQNGASSDFRRRNNEEEPGPGGALTQGQGTANQQQDQQRGFVVSIKGRTPADREFAGRMIGLLIRQTPQVIRARNIRVVGFKTDDFQILLDEEGLWKTGLNVSPLEGSDEDFVPGSGMDDGMMDEGFNGGMMPGGQGPNQGQQPGYLPDPIFPNDRTENAWTDTGFVAVWALTIEGDGIPEIDFADPKKK